VLTWPIGSSSSWDCCRRFLLGGRRESLKIYSFPEN
jgi:hypothetical protein